MRVEVRAHLAFVLQNASDVVPGSLVDAAHLMGLASDEAHRIAAIHLLVGDMASQFAAGLPAALRSLPRTTVISPEIGPAVRAAIDWSATVNARSQGGWGRTTFVTLPPLRHFDVPETRVLRYTLLAMGELLRLAGRAAELVSSFDWRARMAAVEAAHDLGRRNWVLMSASPPGPLVERVLAQAAQARSDYVRNVVVPLARLYRTLFELLATKDDIRAFLSKTLFEVIDDWHMFELTILFRLAREFAHRSRAYRLGLLEPGRPDTFGSFELMSGGTLELRFQRRPVVKRTADPLFRVLRHYDLPVQGPGTPDICIDLRGSAEKRLLIEAKYSSDPQYLAEGVYQLDSYLRSLGGGRIESTGLLVGDWYSFEGRPPTRSKLSATSARLVLSRTLANLAMRN
jgi:hypothetical protein